MRRSATLLAAGLIAVVVAGCSVSVDDNPRAIPQEARGNLEAAPANIGNTAETSRIFLLDARQDGDPAVLRSVARAVPSTPQEALEALFAGPTPDELDQGLSTALPSGLRLASAPRSAGETLSIDITSQINDLSGEDRILAIAQIVTTASEFSGVERVRIRVDGVNQAWPDSRGNPVTTTLSIYDYANLLGSAQPSYPAVPSN
jgi:spore germination protein GerM